MMKIFVPRNFTHDARIVGKGIHEVDDNVAKAYIANGQASEYTGDVGSESSKGDKKGISARDSHSKDREIVEAVKRNIGEIYQVFREHSTSAAFGQEPYSVNEESLNAKPLNSERILPQGDDLRGGGAGTEDAFSGNAGEERDIEKSGPYGTGSSATSAVSDKAAELTSKANEERRKVISGADEKKSTQSHQSKPSGKKDDK